MSNNASDDFNILKKNAIDELRKLRDPDTDVCMDIKKQADAKSVLNQSIAFADNVLKRLVAHTLNIDIDDIFEDYMDTIGEVLIKESDSENNVRKEYTLSLDLVPHDYMLDLKHLKDHAGVKERIVFLLNTVKVLYCTIKDYMKKWSADNNTTFNKVLQIGLNTTLFLDKDADQRIGIIFKSIDK